MEGVFEKEYEIKYYDIDKYDKLTDLALVRYLQEISTLYSDTVDCGMDFANRTQIVWILIETYTKINRLPSKGDKVIYRTWSTGSKGLYAYRQYEVLDENNEVIAVSNSKWVLYSGERKRPIKVIDEVSNKYIHIDKNVVDSDFIHIPDSNKYDDIKNEVVKYMDVDTNWHMNNTNYLKYAIESMTDEFLDKYTIDEYSIKYIHQLKYNENMNICINKINDLEYMYYIKKDINEKSNCDIYIKWKQK